jgi:hypothetical protein
VAEGDGVVEGVVEGDEVVEGVVEGDGVVEMVGEVEDVGEGVGELVGVAAGGTGHATNRALAAYSPVAYSVKFPFTGFHTRRPLAGAAIAQLDAGAVVALMRGATTQLTPHAARFTERK